MDAPAATAAGVFGTGRGDAARGRAAVSAAGVRHRFVAVLRQQVENDWQRTLHDIRWNAGVPASWFRDAAPSWRWQTSSSCGVLME